MKKRFLILIFLVVVLIAYLSYKYQLAFNSVGIAFTILGFILVIKQNIQIKSLAEEAKRVSEETRHRIFLFDVSSKIPETRQKIELVKRELQELNLNKLQIILYRISELADFLIEIKHNKTIKEIIPEEDLENFIEIFNNTKDELDKEILSRTLVEEELTRFTRSLSLDLNRIDKFLSDLNIQLRNNGETYNGQ